MSHYVFSGVNFILICFLLLNCLLLCDHVTLCLLGYTVCEAADPGGALGYFLGGYVPPRTPNWHPVLKKKSPKIDTPF